MLILFSVICIVIGSVHSAACVSPDDSQLATWMMPLIPIAFSAVLVAQQYLITGFVKIIMENVWLLIMGGIMYNTICGQPLRRVTKVALGSILCSLLVWQRCSDHWIPNNAVLLIGIYFVLSIVRIGEEREDDKTSWKMLVLMMVGLVVYDAFFVFGTSLMNPVDWKLPQFIKYPTSHGYNMLGGGDIALPGLIIAYLYRYDIKHLARSRIFFYAGMAAYVISLYGCGLILQYFQASQPALIYILPSLLMSTMLSCWYTGEWNNFSVFNT